MPYYQELLKNNIFFVFKLASLFLISLYFFDFHVSPNYTMSSKKVGIGNKLKTTSSPSSVPRGSDENKAHASFGSIGYTFRKYFPGHGYFTGRVVKIREGAGEVMKL